MIETWLAIIMLGIYIINFAVALDRKSLVIRGGNQGKIERYQFTEKGAIEALKQELIERGFDNNYHSYLPNRCKRLSKKEKFGGGIKARNCDRSPNHIGACAGYFSDGKYYHFIDGELPND